MEGDQIDWEAIMSEHLIFVYGTLMKGQRNHDRFLGNSTYAGTAILPGYALCDLGSYPAIYPDTGASDQSGTSAVKGELYTVNEEDLLAIHDLEGEGSLYHHVDVTVLDEQRHPVSAGTYVFASDCSDGQRVPVGCQPWRYGWQRDLVWYACYGSNLLEERFLHYLQGGTCRFNGRPYKACRNPSPPMDSQPFRIPYDMYFGNSSPSWDDGGVSFLDASRSGEAIGRVYLITKEQLAHVHTQEGKGNDWYDTMVELGSLNGIPVRTFTNHARKEGTIPVEKYLHVLRLGLKETCPSMSDQEIAEYLQLCMARQGMKQR